MKKFLKRAGVGALGLLAMMAVLNIGFSKHLHRSLPQMKGQIAVTGIADPVEILRDANAVPHIYGQNDTDIFYGLGYAHAQDRLWQMEITRRIAQGRLAEIFGSLAALPDKYIRAVGLYRAAQAAVAHMPKDSLAALEAYSSGVNAFLLEAENSLPPEFLLLWHRPEPWTPVDSIAITKFMALGLSTNVFREILRARATKRLTRQQIAELMPPDPGDLRHLLLALSPEMPFAALGSFPETWMKGASNNWVVDGTRTTSGKPLLANDPHLGLSAPSVWYLAHLAFPGGHTIGGTIPGIPSIILGRNENIAWGYTNTGPDTQDLFLEKIDPTNPNRYLAPNGATLFETRTELIKVRFGADQTAEIRSTRHGPVIPMDSGDFLDFTPDGHVLALSWPALFDDDLTAHGGLTMMRAKNWDAFLDALRSYHSPMQNMVYGDLAGNIGLIAPARVPIRNAKSITRGLAPMPGWTGENDWVGFVPFDELPQRLNPDSGVIVTANNKIVGENYPHQITLEWDSDERARRIRTLIDAQNKHSMKSFMAMQMDETSQLALDLLPALLRLPSRDALDAREVKALRVLAEWTGEMSADRREPLIFTAWIRNIVHRLFVDELGDQIGAAWSHQSVFLLKLFVEGAPLDHWCDDAATPSKEGCAALVVGSLRDALDELEARYGKNHALWRWGHAHQAIHAHRPFSLVPVLANRFNISHETGGGAFTINRGQNSFGSSRPYANIHGSGYRAVYDFADLDESVYIQSTGQSGNPLSVHYDDLAKHWAQGKFLKMTTKRDAIEKDALGTLVLTPQ